MKRTIKFRAWDTKTGRMASKLNLDWHGGVPELNDAFELMQRHSILMQFTGMLDSEKNEIYEGDVVQIDGVGLCRVVYYDTMMKFFFEVIHPEGVPNFEARSENIHIMGNVFENPALLI